MKMLGLLNLMIAENDEVHSVVGHAFLIDPDEIKDGMEHGLSDFDAALMSAVSQDALDQARWPIIDLTKAIFHAYNAQKVALYNLYAQRLAVLNGEATVDSLIDYARRYDVAYGAYIAAYYASAGLCAYAKRQAERVEDANAY